jgi:hypothetical protein
VVRGDRAAVILGGVVWNPKEFRGALSENPFRVWILCPLDTQDQFTDQNVATILAVYRFQRLIEG